MNVSVKQNNIIRWHIVLNNDISIVIETKLCSSVKSWIVNKFSDVRMFTLGLDAGFLGAGITLIMNENLAKHVSKISEIPSRFLMVYLLFKNKQSVSVLGLYAEAFLDRHIIQAGLINFFIARACNKSTFVILGGNFNEDENKHSFSFNKCVELGLVNILVNSSYIKTSTWRNSRSVEKTIDYIFVSQSLSNALVNECVVDVDEFFSTDYSSVQITIGLGGILDPVLRAICVQANKNKWKFNVKNADRISLAKIRKFYCSLKMIKSKHARNSQIRLAIDKKIENFELNKGQTIRNVLEWPFHKVTLNHLIVNKDLILEPGLVKFYVDRIIKGWTRKHVMVDNVSNKWHCQFQLLEYVFDDAFLNVMHPIKMEEFFSVILSLPDNKAAGLSGITNEL
ncbi:hypothetical protein G9A89_012969 [Geosiphon pyriformis]|nr:hypothetical protein G9A89_012969 [Geosiphon pyriformis]